MLAIFAFVGGGGEEFVAVLPKTTQEQAYEIAERIRIGLQTSQFFPDEEITCSIGVTQKKSLRRKLNSLIELIILCTKQKT